MDIKEQVGETAGKVWQALSAGPLSVARLKKKLDGSGDLVHFALGWLAREGKVDMVQEKRSLKVSLR